MPHRNSNVVGTVQCCKVRKWNMALSIHWYAIMGLSHAHDTFAATINGQLHPLCLFKLRSSQCFVTMTNFVCFSFNVFHIFSPHKSNSPPKLHFYTKNPGSSNSPTAQTHAPCSLTKPPYLLVHTSHNNPICLLPTLYIPHSLTPTTTFLIPLNTTLTAFAKMATIQILSANRRCS